jgi:hypothetical protein
MPLNKSVAIDFSAGEGPESRQDDSSILQKEPSETAGISSLSDAVMVVSPPSSGGMDIKSMLETMQIGPPQADDSMKMNISSKNPE